MRKTVQEWLESHQNGNGMGKKKRRGGARVGVGAGKAPVKKAGRKKVKRKPR
jgi:hypothetical protein